MLPCDVEYREQTKSDFPLTTIGFADIYDVWNEHLWSDRKSPILPLSSLKRGGGYDMTIYSYSPMFLAIFDTRETHLLEKIVAVNSFFQTGPDEFRSRGIWVDPEYRGMKLGKMIMKETIDRVSRASTSKEKILWTIPRQSAMPFYESCGFVRTSDWFDEGMEFGPNAYAERVVTR